LRRIVEEFLPGLMSQKAKHFYAFGPFQLDSSECVLTLDGKSVPLAPKAFEALVILVENAGHLVDKDDLMKRLWPDSFVEEGNVAKHVSLLRKVLSDATGGRDYIETIPKRGYRFVVDVTEVADAGADSVSPAVSQPKRASAHWRELVAGGVAVLLIASAYFWIARHQAFSARPRSDLKVRQLTSNSAENDVTSGTISPDGNYLAYADVGGVHIQNVASGESQNVPLPEGLSGNKAEWEVGFWFPDSTRLLVNAHSPGQDRAFWNSQGTSIWLVSVLGGPPRKLRENAESSTISPDGSFISFGANSGKFGDREIWLMDPNGEHPRRLFGLDQESSLMQLNWSRDATRVVYQKTDGSGITILSSDLKGGPATTVLSASQAARLRDYVWLPDGRFIYTSGEAEATGVGDTACNFWQERVDATSGKPVGEPTRLTNWPDFCNSYLSATADGKRLTFLRAVVHFTTYVADLEADGARIANPKRFTLTERWDLPADWTRDSNAVIMRVEQTGHYALYKKTLQDDLVTPIASDPKELWNPRLSSDGNWVLYQRRIKADDSSPSEILRVPLAGGTPQAISTVGPGSLLFCTKAPSKSCAIVEPSGDHRQLIVATFDPLTGRGSEISRFALDTTMDLAHIDMSPDGTRLAVIRDPEGPVHILPLSGQAPSEIKVKHWNNLQSVNWTADGRGLYISNGIARGVALLHVDMQGNAQVLWKNRGYNSTVALPSPDGRHMAIIGSSWDDSIWMMENF
jgi:DNA-binding winged helix-turn-helix (wHTH) protein/Tol biopolymer transport system component